MILHSFIKDIRYLKIGITFLQKKMIKIWASTQFCCCGVISLSRCCIFSYILHPTRLVFRLACHPPFQCWWLWQETYGSNHLHTCYYLCWIMHPTTYLVGCVIQKRINLVLGLEETIFLSKYLVLPHDMIQGWKNSNLPSSSDHFLQQTPNSYFIDVAWPANFFACQSQKLPPAKVHI